MRERERIAGVCVVGRSRVKSVLSGFCFGFVFVFGCSPFLFPLPFLCFCLCSVAGSALLLSSVLHQAFCASHHPFHPLLFFRVDFSILLDVRCD